MKRPRIWAGGFYFSRGFAARALRANFAAPAPGSTKISPLLHPARQNRHATQATKYTKKVMKFGLKVLTGKACLFNLNLSMKLVKKILFTNAKSFVILFS